VGLNTAAAEGTASMGWPGGVAYSSVLNVLPGGMASPVASGLEQFLSEVLPARGGLASWNDILGRLGHLGKGVLPSCCDFA